MSKLATCLIQYHTFYSAETIYSQFLIEWNSVFTTCGEAVENWMYCSVLDVLGRRLNRSAASDCTEYTAYCVTFGLLYVCSPWQTSENRLLWLWTKAAVMLDWGSDTLDTTTAGIAGISYCLYGFGYCAVLMLAVLTDGRWKLAATYCNTIRCHHCVMML